MPPLTGRVIAGRYDLRTPIGRGAMGVVWRAHDNLLDREVAVKEVVISALISEDERRNAYQRTLREARTAARLSHRGVVAIYDVVEEEGRPWIIMELVPSQSLDQLLTVEHRLTPARSGRIGQQLLSALAAAHSAGVLHRDVKPSNVLIATSRVAESWDERAVLTDFGIAQFEGDPRLTQTGMVMGSPGFTAPERIRGADATFASDLWSLGATVYAAVEGRGPYENRGGAITTMSAIINEDAPVAPHAGPLAPVIAALLRRDPRGRPSAAQAARMLAQVLPQLRTSGDVRPSAKHSPTVRAGYVPSPDDGGAQEKQTETADAALAADKPATAKPAANKPAANDKPSAKTPPAAAAAAPKAAPEAEAEEAAPDSGAEAEAASAPAPEPEAADKHEPVDKQESESESATADKPDAEPESELAQDKPLEGKPAEEKPAAAGKPAADKQEKDDESGAVTVQRAVPTKAPEVPSATEPAKKQQVADKVAPIVGADTVVPSRSGSGYRPTEVAAPVARTARPASESPAQASPKPTFTAAKPSDRPAQNASPARPSRPASPGRPTPPRLYESPPKASQPPSSPPSQRSARDQSYAEPSAQRFPAGNSFRQSAQVGPGRQAGPQYPGPQPAPDLSRMYPPGVGGGHGNNGRGTRRLLWLLIAVIVAIAIGVGAALMLNARGSGTNADAGLKASDGTSRSASMPPTMADSSTGVQAVDALNSPSTQLPGANWTTQTVTKAQAGSIAAGYSIDVPPGWTEQQVGLATNITGPNGQVVEVDLTQQTTTNMLAAEAQVEQETIPKSPGYQRLTLKAVPVRHTQGSVWEFSWVPSQKPQTTAQDVFFAQNTSGGVQDYAVLVSAPSSSFNAQLPTFDKILQTFQVVS